MCVHTYTNLRTCSCVCWLFAATTSLCPRRRPSELFAPLPAPGLANLCHSNSYHKNRRRLDCFPDRREGLSWVISVCAAFAPRSSKICEWEPMVASGLQCRLYQLLPGISLGVKSHEQILIKEKPFIPRRATNSRVGA